MKLSLFSAIAVRFSIFCLACNPSFAGDPASTPVTDTFTATRLENDDQVDREVSRLLTSDNPEERYHALELLSHHYNEAIKLDPDFKEFLKKGFMSAGGAEDIDTLREPETLLRGHSDPELSVTKLVKMLLGKGTYEPRSWDYRSALNKALSENHSYNEAVKIADIQIGNEILSQIQKNGIWKYVLGITWSTNTQIPLQQHSGTGLIGSRLDGEWAVGWAQKYSKDQLAKAMESNPNAIAVTLDIDPRQVAGLYSVLHEYILLSKIPARVLKGVYIGLPDPKQYRKYEWLYLRRDSPRSVSLFSTNPSATGNGFGSVEAHVFNAKSSRLVGTLSLDSNNRRVRLIANEGALPPDLKDHIEGFLKLDAESSISELGPGDEFLRCIKARLLERLH